MQNITFFLENSAVNLLAPYSLQLSITFSETLSTKTFLVFQQQWQHGWHQGESNIRNWELTAVENILNDTCEFKNISDANRCNFVHTVVEKLYSATIIKMHTM